MGGILPLCSGTLYPSREGCILYISGCARSHPYSTAMATPSDKSSWPAQPGTMGPTMASPPPTHVHGNETRKTTSTAVDQVGESKAPALCLDFLIETYLDHAGEKWCLEYDANSLLYVVC